MPRWPQGCVPLRPHPPTPVLSHHPVLDGGPQSHVPHIPNHVPLLHYQWWPPKTTFPVATSSLTMSPAISYHPVIDGGPPKPCPSHPQPCSITPLPMMAPRTTLPMTLSSLIMSLTTFYHPIIDGGPPKPHPPMATSPTTPSHCLFLLVAPITRPQPVPPCDLSPVTTCPSPVLHLSLR